MSRFLDRLAAGGPVILDGATGTELLRRGYRTELPLWSAGALQAAPDLVRAIHRDYAQAGAEIVTANTFRTNPRTLEKVGLRARAKELNRLAVELARESGAAFVAGSIAPLEDCYRPDLVPAPEVARREHGEMAGLLADAGCDLLLVETMNTIAEACAALEAAKATGLPVLVGFVCGVDGRLLSGESAEAAARAADAFGPAAVLVNCTPLAAIPRALEALRRGTARPLGAYANIGCEDPVVGWTLTDDVEPEPYARAAREWVKLGARIVGGCCGTTPEHVRRLAMAQDREETTEARRTEN